MNVNDLIERLNDAWRKLYGDGDEHDVCDTIAEAAAALEAARADAERYRWLKKSAFCNVWERGDGIALVAPRTPMADIDSRIDAAIANSTGEQS